MHAVLCLLYSSGVPSRVPRVLCLLSARRLCHVEPARQWHRAGGWVTGEMVAGGDGLVEAMGDNEDSAWLLVNGAERYI